MMHFLAYAGPDGRQGDAEKSIIYSHIARHSHKNRHRGHVKGVRRKNNYHVKFKDVDVLTLAQQPSCCTHGLKRFAPCANCETSGTGEWPLQMLNGNSDPFCSYGRVQIDSQANHYVDFARNGLEVVVESWGFRGVQSPAGFVPSSVAKSKRLSARFDLAGRKLVQEISDTSLTEACSTLFTFSSLGYFAASLANKTGREDHKENAEFYAEQCYAVMSKTSLLSHEDSLPSLDFLVFRILKFVNALGRYSQAAHWVYFLQRLLHKKAESQVVSRGLVAMIIFQDNILSLSQWKDPIFNEAWLERLFRSDWTLAGLPTLRRSPSEDLDSELGQTESLQDLMASTRRLLVTTAMREKNNKTASEGDWYWYMGFIELLQIKLFRFFRKLEFDQQTQCPSSISDLNGCLALCSIYSLRHRVQVTIMASILHRSTANILSHLESLFTRLTVSMTVKEAAEISDALLYVVFIAALAEWQCRCMPAIPLQSRVCTWKDRLTDLVTYRRFITWEQLEQVLEQFPYTAHELPMPSPGWLDDAFRMSVVLNELDKTHGKLKSLQL